MLIVLGLIDVVMINNLLVMVVVGSPNLRLPAEPWGPSRPAGMAEPRQRQRAQSAKAGVAIIGISSIHLLKTFIGAGQLGLPLCGARLAADQ